jgi:acyl carrier protein
VTSGEIFARIQERLAVEFDVDAQQIRPESTFAELGLDSIDLMSAVMDFEDAFDLEVADEELQGLATVADAVDLMARKLSVVA